MEFNEKITKLIKEKQEELGLNMKGIALESGISEGSLSNFKNGKSTPEFDALKKLKKFFGVSYEYLLDDNCINKTSTNISISKELALSDESISVIKSTNDIMNAYYDVYDNCALPYYDALRSNSFNTLIEYVDLINLCSNVSKLQRNMILYRYCMLLKSYQHFRKTFDESFECNNELLIEITKKFIDISNNFKLRLYSMDGAYKPLLTVISLYNEILNKLESDNYKEYKNDIIKIFDSLVFYIDYIIKPIKDNIKMCKFYINECINSFSDKLILPYNLNNLDENLKYEELDNYYKYSSLNKK